MAQVPQSGTFFVAKAADEIRIVQALIAGRLRHILQHAQLLLDYRGHDLHWPEAGSDSSGEAKPAAPVLDAAAAGQRADSAPRRKREGRCPQRERESSHRIGISCTAFFLCAPSSLLPPLTCAAVAAHPHRHPPAPAEDPSAAQNSATRRDLPAPANPASWPDRYSGCSARSACPRDSQATAPSAATCSRQTQCAAKRASSPTNWLWAAARPQPGHAPACRIPVKARSTEVHQAAWTPR